MEMLKYWESAWTGRCSAWLAAAFTRALGGGGQDFCSRMQAFWRFEDVLKWHWYSRKSLHKVCTTWLQWCFRYGRKAIQVGVHRAWWWNVRAQKANTPLRVVTTRWAVRVFESGSVELPSTSIILTASHEHTDSLPQMRRHKSKAIKESLASSC